MQEPQKRLLKPNHRSFRSTFKIGWIGRLYLVDSFVLSLLFFPLAYGRFLILLGAIYLAYIK